MRKRLIALLLTLVCVFTLLSAALPAYAVEQDGAPTEEAMPAPETNEASETSAEPEESNPSEQTEAPEETEAPDPTPTPEPTPKLPWYTDAMAYAQENGLLKGDEKGNMNPTQKATRAQVATILVRVFGCTQGKDVTQFTDMRKSAWYYDAVSIAAEMGILLGDAEFTMRPGAPITRQEAFAVISRAFSIPAGDPASLSQFKDGDQVSNWAKATVAGMVEAGLLKGDRGKLNPKGNITRAEFAQVLYRMNIAFCKDASALPETGTVVYSGPSPLDVEGFAGTLYLGGGIGSSITLKGDAPEAAVFVRMDPKAKVTVNGAVGDVGIYTRSTTLTGSGSARSVDVRAAGCTVSLAADAKTEKYDVGLTGVTATVPTPNALTPERRSVTVTVRYAGMDSTGTANGSRSCTVHWWLDGVRQSNKKVTLNSSGGSVSFTVSESVWKRTMPSGHKLKIQLLYGTDYVQSSVTVPVQNYTDAEYAQIARNASYPYRIEVVKNQCTVLVYGLDKSGNYTILHKAFVCSPGQSTPIGSFRTPSKMRWNPLMGGVWGQYCTQITGNFLFHSVFYHSTDPSTLYYNAYNQLGTICSHGCVRVTVADAKWMYDNCPLGTTVQIYNSSTLPVAKPTAQKIPTDSPYRGWDPTDPDPRNPWNK